MAVEAEDIRLLKNPRFRRLLEARLIGQTGLNAMMYALLILVVADTDSSLMATLLVVSFTLPSIILGIPAGTLTDMLPRRLTLTLSYLLRAVIAVALIYYRGDLVSVFLLAAASASVGQFSGPAEAATVPAVVKREQLSAANSLMVLSLLGGQVAGMVVLAPILIKLLDVEAVFALCVLLFIGATYILGWMASGFTHKQDEERPSIGFVEATKEGFRILRTKRLAYLSILYLVTALALSRVLVILFPKYTADVLQISPEDTVFVVAPAAIGAGAGLLVVPLLAKTFGAWRVAAFGFAMFLMALVALGLVVYVRDFIQANFDFGITFLEERFGLASVITVTMFIAIPAGFAFTLISVAARAVMNQEAPLEAQGRVFAVQMAIGDFLSLLPLLMIGAIADIVGVRATLLTAASAAALLAAYLTFSQRFGPPREQAPPETAPQPGSV